MRVIYNGRFGTTRIVGPGGFTELRLGLEAARAIADALGVDLERRL